MIELSNMRIKRLVATLPYTLPVFIAVFTIIAILFLICDFFVSEYIWTVGGIFSFLLAYLTHKRILPYVDISKSSLWGVLTVLVACIVWFLGNAHYTSQHIYVDRDPGVYSTSAMWLMHHDDLHIKQDYQIFGSDKTERRGSPGYTPSIASPNELSPQGAQAFPVLLALIGRIVGVEGMLHAAPLFGALGIFTFFGFLQLFLKRQKWAIVGAAILSVSLPLLYFSRDTYSEPLALVFAFSSLAMIYFAQKTGHKYMWFIAGLAAGASALTRIDSLLSTAGLLMAIFLMIAQAPRKQKKESYVHAIIFILTAAILFGLALFNLAYLASGYLKEQLPLMKLEMIVVVGLMIVGFGYNLLPGISKKVENLIEKNIQKITTGLAYAAGAIGLILLSRPLWYISLDKQSLLGIIAIQTKFGLAIDGFRNYAENSLGWMMWYIGPLTVFLAFAGLIIVTVRILKSRNIIFAAFVGVVGGASIVYLNFPSITGDQIWASRRFLPVVIPGLIALAMMALATVEEYKPKIASKVRRHMTPALLAVAFCCLLGALITSSPFVRTRTYDGEFSHAMKICRRLPENSALLLTGDYSFTAVQTFRSLCKNDLVVASVRHDTELTREDVSKINTSVKGKGKKLYIGALRYNSPILIDSGVDRPYSSVEVSEYERTLTKPPEFTTALALNFYFSEVDEFGHILPVE
jgi:hypothetical protein